MVLPKFNLSTIRRLFMSRSTISSSIPNVRSRDSVSSSPIPSSSYVPHQPSSLRYMSSVLTNNSSGVTVPSSSSSTTTMVGPLIFRHDPGRWICSMHIHGVHFVSGKSVMDYFLQTLASVVGSIEEAKKRIYFVTCEWDCFFFGVNIDEQTSMKLEDVPGVDYVFEDNHFDARNKFAAVRSIPKFFPLNWGHRLVDMSRYHESSKLNMERDQDPGHWLIKIREPADGFSAAEEVVDSCINLLAAVVGRKEAIKKIYVVWCTKPYGFGAEIDMGTLKKLKELPNLECFPDHAFDVKNDFGILVICKSACPNSSSPAGLHYWPLDDTYGSREEVINSDEDNLDSDEGNLDSDDDGYPYHYDEKDLESDADNLKSDDLDQSIC